MLKKSDMKKYIELVYEKSLPYSDVASYFKVNVHRISNYRARYNLPKRGWANGHPMTGKSIPAWNKGKVGEKSHSWNGGKTKSSQGYILVYSPNHPSTKNSGTKYVGEHRLVMEKYLNRFLRPNEHVHHKNGNKTDNRIKNLEVLSASEHIKKHPDSLFSVGHKFHSR